MIPGMATNPLDTLIGYRLRRVSAAAMDQLTRDLACIALRPAQASIIMLVGANPGMRPSDAGRQLDIARANMVPLVAGLERRGLLVRNVIDGRSHGLVLTVAGQAACKRALQVSRRHDARLTRGLDEAEVESLRHLLGLLSPQTFEKCQPDP